MNKKFNPMLGDISDVLQNEKENKFRLLYFISLALENKDYDFYLNQIWDMTIINILSEEAMNQFENLIPNHIDRHNHFGLPVKNILDNSLAVTESTQKCNDRRKEAIKTIGINHISRYIPLMIETVDEWAKNVKRNQKIDLSLEITKIVFKVISKILFGTDLDKMPPIQYKSPKTGEISSMNMDEFYFRYTRDEFDGLSNPKRVIIPFATLLRLVEPYHTNKINNRSFFWSHQIIYSSYQRYRVSLQEARGTWQIFWRYFDQRYFSSLLKLYFLF